MITQEFYNTRIFDVFFAFFHHADTESYATIKRSIDSHVTA